MAISLKNLHTFSIDANAEEVCFFDSVESLTSLYKKYCTNKPYLILGQGSNVLFVEDFNGVVLINKIKGFVHNQDHEFHYLDVGAGEIWHDLIKKTLELGIYGLENLALIPGNVGSAPIQNIGAYGSEFQLFCDFVEFLDFDSLQIKTLSKDECLFGYRDSIFKSKYKNACISKVRLKLPKIWQPNVVYAPLNQLHTNQISAPNIFNLVVKTRQEKLPNPKIYGNAGSFFKNPIISNDLFNELLLIYPHIPHYTNDQNTTKLAAGWLIDQCNLKGYSIGGASVHEKQALVLINKNNATSNDIINLANHIIQTVFQKFNVKLSPEVRFIGKNGEIKID